MLQLSLFQERACHVRWQHNGERLRQRGLAARKRRRLNYTVKEKQKGSGAAEVVEGEDYKGKKVKEKKRHPFHLVTTNAVSGI